MPSLQSIFLLATVAFASFTYGAPLGDGTGLVASPLSGTSNGISLPQLPNAGGLNVPRAPVTAVNVDAKRGNKPESLPAILKGLEPRLHQIRQKLGRFRVFPSYHYT